LFGSVLWVSPGLQYGFEFWFGDGVQIDEVTAGVFFFGVDIRGRFHCRRQSQRTKGRRRPPRCSLNKGRRSLRQEKQGHCWAATNLHRNSTNGRVRERQQQEGFCVLFFVLLHDAESFVLLSCMCVDVFSFLSARIDEWFWHMGTLMT
jgi:hypothetical protein